MEYNQQVAVNPRELRNALSCFGTGVTVVTAIHEDGSRVGVTANSFNSVSLDPPIVLWSLSLKSQSLRVFQESGRFAINVLAADQVHLSQGFSRPSNDKFADVKWTPGLGGVPVLDGCAAVLECSVYQAQKAGDHMLFLGQVERFSYRDTPTLLFCRGQYLNSVQSIAA